MMKQKVSNEKRGDWDLLMGGVEEKKRPKNRDT